MYFTAKHQELIDQLQELCPIAFPKKPSPKVALAHGQHIDIQRILSIDKATSIALLNFWCKGHRYDLACSIEGVLRLRYDGSVGGKVSLRESQIHKRKLDGYYETRVAPKGYKVTPREPKSFFATAKEMLRSLWRKEVAQ